MQLRCESYNKEYRKYANENCNRSGAQKKNTDDRITRGIRSLQKRVKNQEVMVLCTDKSGKSSLPSRDMYIKMGEEHTSKDLNITWEKTEEITKTLVKAAKQSDAATRFVIAELAKKDRVEIPGLPKAEAPVLASATEPTVDPDKIMNKVIR